MRGLLSIGVLLAVFLGAAAGCTSRQPPAAPDQPKRGGDGKDDVGGGDDSSAQGFETPEAALDAYGKAMLDGNGGAYRKIAAKDDKAVQGLDAIILFEKGKSPEEAAKINLQAMAPIQGFGSAVAKRFPAEISGGDAIIIQLFEREIALKKEIHFRKFKFSKSGGKWYLVGSEFGEASTLPARYAWNEEAETKVVESSAQAPMSFLPQDAFAAVVVHPRRAARSEIGQTLLKLDFVQVGLRQSQFKPDDIEQIIYATGIATAESVNDCTIVRFAKPVLQAALLKEEFGELPYEEVQFNGAGYYRYSDESSRDDGVRPAETNSETQKGAPHESPKVLAKFPDDMQPGANGHADSSDSGNWIYYRSDKQDAMTPDAQLTMLDWNPTTGRYEGTDSASGRMWPAIGRSLHPAFNGPRYVVLRWKSRSAASVTIRGNFSRPPNEKKGNGVRVLVFVAGELRFSQLVKRGAAVANFEIPTSVKTGSVVDFVVDPNGDSGWDSTLLDVTIEHTDVSEDVGVDLLKAREARADQRELAIPFGNAIYFLDDRTIVTTEEQQLRRLIADAPAQTPLTKKLTQLDLDHDLIGVVALEGRQEQAAELLELFLGETGSAELEGLGGLPQHAMYAIANVDLAGPSLLRIEVDANNANSAEKVLRSAENLVNILNGLRHLIPTQIPVAGEDGSPTSIANPLVPVLERLAAGIVVRQEGTQVVIDVASPAGLVAFVREDAPKLTQWLAGLDSEAAADTRATIPERGEEAGDKPTEVKYRPPPKDHPEFRELAVESLDCRVFFPGKPEFTEQDVKIDEGNVHVANFQGKTRRATYVFEIYTYPKAFVTKTGAKPLLVQTRDNLVDAPRGRLISSTPNTVRDTESLDFVYEHPDTTGTGKGHCRIVIRGNRVYVLEVDGFKVPPAEITIFHDSLVPFALAAGGTARPETVETPKLLLPDAAARAAALKLVREVYKSKFDDARTTEAKSALAATMIEDSAGIDNPHQRFVMLDVARRIAVALPEVATTFKTIDRLDAEFQVESVSLKIQSLLELSRSRIVAKEQLEFVDRLVDVAEEAIASDAFDASVELLTLAQTHARQARELVLVRQITERLNEAKQLDADFSALDPSLKVLNDNLTDPEASLAIGRFRCFGQGNWQVGLVLLGQCSDERLKMLAQADLAAPAASVEQIAVGDRWWELADEHEGLFQKQIRQRSAHWYRLAQASVTGLEKQKLDSRLEEVTHVGIPLRSVDLLKLIDLRKHVVKGNWNAYRGTLVSPEDSAARVVIPFDPPTEYDLTIVVERKTKDNHFALGLTVDGVLTFVLFDYRNSSRTALFSSPQLGYTNPVFINNKQATIVASVRKGSLTVSTDGKEILNWHGQSRLTPPSDPDWRVPDETKLFIGTSSSAFQIHRIEVTPQR